MKLILILILFYQTDAIAKNSCSELFGNDQRVALIKPQITSLTRYQDYIEAYGRVSAKLEAFMNTHNSIGENKPYPISESPISEFLVVTEKMLRNFENDPVILGRIGSNLSNLWFHSMIPHEGLNRAVLKVRDNNKVIDLAADWHLADRGILNVIFTFLEQKNHSGDSLSEFANGLGSELSTGVHRNILSEATANKIATAYENALSKIPIKDRQFLFSTYAWDVIRFQSKEWSFKRAKLITYFEELIAEKVEVNSMFLGQITSHLGKNLDVELTRLVIVVTSQIKSEPEYVKESRFNQMKELILESNMSEAEKSQLIKEAELHIMRIISQES